MVRHKIIASILATVCVASMLSFQNNCLGDLKSSATSYPEKSYTARGGASATMMVSAATPAEKLSSQIIGFFDDSTNKVYDNAVSIYKEAIKPKPIKVYNPGFSLASVTSIKITWDAEEGRNYNVAWEACAEYVENVEIVYPRTGLCYITGLRTNTDYDITVTPIIEEGERAEAVPVHKTVHTSNPEVIQEFDYIDGWTNCFAGEKASGLTAMPSSGAIYGSHCDDITGTGIRRFDNGDYCCAMGTHFGYCNDRFLVELENGIQFTVRICDSKGCGDVQDEAGYGLWHNFGGSGKCIIEFIWDDGNLPGCVAFSGSWGGYNWNGLNLGANIRSIKKLANYDV